MNAALILVALVVLYLMLQQDRGKKTCPYCGGYPDHQPDCPYVL